jgi:hypothetical protein
VRADAGYRAHNSFLSTLPRHLLKRLRRVVKRAHFKYTQDRISDYEVDRIIEQIGPTALARMMEKLRRTDELVDRKVIRPELAANAETLAARVEPED